MAIVSVTWHLFAALKSISVLRSAWAREWVERKKSVPLHRYIVFGNVKLGDIEY